MQLPSNSYDQNYTPPWKKRHMDPKQLGSDLPEGVSQADAHNWGVFKRHLTKASARAIHPEVYEADSGKYFEIRGYDDWGMTVVETYPFKRRESAEAALREVEKLLEGE